MIIVVGFFWFDFQLVCSPHLCFIIMLRTLFMSLLRLFLGESLRSRN